MQYGKFAEVYDALMKGVNYDTWSEYASGLIKDGRQVLECACGTGEISLRLAKMGYSVLATDVSDDMLLIAQEKQRRAGLAMSGLRFVHMDMRRLAAGKKQDCVISCCDGVNYLLSREDVKAFFTSANSVLKPGGKLLFDISSRHKLKNILGNNCFSEDGRELAYIWQNAYDDGSKLVEMRLSFFKRKGELYERFDETHIQRAHSLREIGSWLEETGYQYEAYSFGTREKPKDDDERIQFSAWKL